MPEGRYLLRNPKNSSGSTSSTSLSPRVKENNDKFIKDMEIEQMYRSIDKMTFQEAKDECNARGLTNIGKRKVVNDRLKIFCKMEILNDTHSNKNRNLDYLVVVDFEATCEKKNPLEYKHEIIEFPAILICSHTMSIVDSFHEYVRPVINPMLSEFCKSLTGISQTQVDKSDSFEVVHNKFVQWLEFHKLGEKYTFSLVTDGPFDMGRFLFPQVLYSKIEYPSYAKTWINIRKCFEKFYRNINQKAIPHHNRRNCPRSSTFGSINLKIMLQNLGLEFEGSPHSGIDDAKNIARIVIKLLNDGAYLRLNEKIIFDGTSTRKRAELQSRRLQTVAHLNSREAFHLFEKKREEIRKRNVEDPLKFLKEKNVMR